MSAASYTPVELSKGAEGEPDLDFVKKSLEENGDFQAAFVSDGSLYIRTYGIEVRADEQGFQAEVVELLRSADPTRYLSELLADQYDADEDVLMGSGTSGGG
ncbi:MAG: hypothetical protein ABEJ07_02860 [Candidatus Nanohaloarchaea archaeon]